MASFKQAVIALMFATLLAPPSLLTHAPLSTPVEEVKNGHAFNAIHVDLLENDYTTWLGNPDSFFKIFINASTIPLNYTGVDIHDYSNYYAYCRAFDYGVGSLGVATSAGIVDGNRTSYKWYPHAMKATYNLSEDLSASVIWFISSSDSLTQTTNITYTGADPRKVTLILMGQGVVFYWSEYLALTYESTYDAIVLSHMPMGIYFAVTSNYTSCSHTVNAANFHALSSDIADGSFANHSSNNISGDWSTTWFGLQYDVTFNPGESRAIIVGVGRGFNESDALRNAKDALREPVLKLNQVREWWNIYLNRAPKVSGLDKDLTYTYYHAITAALSSIHPPNLVAEMPYYAAIAGRDWGDPYVLELYSVIQTVLLVNITLAKNLYMGILNRMNATGYIPKTLYGTLPGRPFVSKYTTPGGSRQHFPKMAYLAWLIYQFEGNKMWLKDVYPKLKLHLQWQQRYPVFDFEVLNKVEVPIGGEWGAYVPIDLRYLKFIAQELGYENDVCEIDVEITDFIKRVNNYMWWNETAKAIQTKTYQAGNVLDYFYGVFNETQRKDVMEALLEDIFPSNTSYFSKYADGAWKFQMPGSVYAITHFPQSYAKTYLERYIRGLHHLRGYSEGYVDIEDPKPAGTFQLNPVSTIISWFVLMYAGFGKVEEGIYIRPYAPSVIENLAIRESTLNIVTKGSGLYINKIVIDGQEVENNVIHLFDRGYHIIEAYLGDAPTLPFLEIRYVAPVLEFAPRRASYTASEDVDLMLSIYRGHGYPRTTTWLVKLTVKDSAGIIVNTTSCNVGLSEGEITTLDFHLGKLNEGEYLAIVEIIDPQSWSVLTSSSLTFEVVSAIPAWLPRVTYTIVTLIVIGVTIVILASLIRYRKI